MPSQPLPQRVLDHNPLELANQFRRVPAGEISLDSVLYRREAQLIEASAEREGKALLLVLLRNGAPVHQARFERVQRMPRPWRRRPRQPEASAGSAQ